MKQTIAILGDSYSTYKDWVPEDYNYWYADEGNECENDITSVEQTWWRQLVTKGDYELIANCSFSGSPVCNTWYDQADATGVSFIKRMYRELGPKTQSPDILLVFGGTNDFWAGVPIGEVKYADWTVEELKSFAPAFCKMMDYLTKTHTSSKIYNIINDEITGPIRKLSLEICEKYQVPCILLENVEKENGHPNQAGMTAICEQVLRAIAQK